MPGRWQEILVPLAGFIPTYTKRSKTAAALRQRLFGFYLLKKMLLPVRRIRPREQH